MECQSIAFVYSHQTMRHRSCLTASAAVLGLSLIEAVEAMLLASCEPAEGAAPCCRGDTALAAASVALAVRIAALVGFPRCRRGRTMSAALLPWVPLLLPPSRGISTVRCCKWAVTAAKRFEVTFPPSGCVARPDARVAADPGALVAG